MSNCFLISDTHFGHKGTTEWTNEDGSKFRPWSTVEEMDEALVANWNSVVGPKDKVYHLGDVVINRRAFPTLGRLNGDKVLIKGNHDLFKLKDYLPYFRDIRASHVLDKFILSHIPLHPASVKERWTANIHGHLHTYRVKRVDYFKSLVIGEKTEVIDPLYFSVCVEQPYMNYTPISLETVKQLVKEQQI